MADLTLKKTIRLSKSCLSERELEAVKLVLDREYLGMGQEVMNFELELKEYFEKDVVCVSSGTAALHLALQACGIGPGDEVIVQSLTYLASVQAITAVGADPVFCDVLPEDLTVNPEDAESLLTHKTKAIMLVHYAGQVGDLDRLYAFANKYNLRVIEDAAHAFGSEFEGVKIGTRGDVVCFSFDGIKNITSGEGGCVVSSDSDILRRVRDSRLLGVENDSDKRYANSRSWNFDVQHQGWRYHMSDVFAAIGRTQLARFDEFQYARQLLSREYCKELTTINSIKILLKPSEEVTPHIFPIILTDGLNRDELRALMEEGGVQTGVHYLPNHQLTFFKRYRKSDLVVTESIANRLLSLPLHPDLNIEDIRQISSLLISSLEKLHCK